MDREFFPFRRRKRGRQNFDRHLAVQARVVSRVHDAHPAVAELGADRVRAEGGAWAETSYVFSQENSSADLTALLSRHHRQVRVLIVRRLARHREDDLETQFDSAARQNGTP